MKPGRAVRPGRGRSASDTVSPPLVQVMTFSLKRQPGGSLAMFNRETGETMHPGAGPWAEANGLYLAGTRLERLLCDISAPGPLHVFDVGLGGAANALAAVTLHQRLASGGRRVRPLRIISFEHDPEAPRFALDHARELGYPRGHEELLEGLLESGLARAGGLTWEARWGDFPLLIQQEETRADVVFFDPFSPRANPAMWSLPTLEGLYNCRRRHGDTILVTYSSSFSVRAALLLAGFFVGEGPQPNPRRATTLAATALGLLDQPLDARWLARWRRDREPWPALSPAGKHQTLRKALLDHPQWQSDLPQSPKLHSAKQHSEKQHSAKQHSAKQHSESLAQGQEPSPPSGRRPRKFHRAPPVDSGKKPAGKRPPHGRTRRPS